MRVSRFGFPLHNRLFLAVDAVNRLLLRLSFRTSYARVDATFSTIWRASTLGQLRGMKNSRSSAPICVSSRYPIFAHACLVRAVNFKLSLAAPLDLLDKVTRATSVYTRLTNTVCQQRWCLCWKPEIRVVPAAPAAPAPPPAGRLPVGAPTSTNGPIKSTYIIVGGSTVAFLNPGRVVRVVHVVHVVRGVCYSWKGFKRGS